MDISRVFKAYGRYIPKFTKIEYPEAIKVRLVMDNLNTHNVASLYETFEASEARSLAERLEIHYTPKHGSWLNMAEIELSALIGQFAMPDARRKLKRLNPKLYLFHDTRGESPLDYPAPDVNELKTL